jgi:hypothetical protein
LGIERIRGRVKYSMSVSKVRKPCECPSFPLFEALFEISRQQAGNCLYQHYANVLLRVFAREFLGRL